MQLSLWAPNAHNLEADLRGRRVPMRQQPKGWWSMEVDTGGAVEYGFVIDGRGRFPIPARRGNPTGSTARRGPSIIPPSLDGRPIPVAAPGLGGHLRIAHRDLHAGRDLRRGNRTHPASRRVGGHACRADAGGRFPWRLGLGVRRRRHLRASPLLRRPRGTQKARGRLHGAGLAAILDVVYNHFGPSGNYLAMFGPYFTDSVADAVGRRGQPRGPESDEVRRFFLDNAAMWLRDYHFDGLRLDAVHALVDTSATHFLEELAVCVEELERELGRHLFLIAESDLNDPRIVRSRDLGGYGLAAQWSDDLHHALHSVITGEREGYYARFRLHVALGEGSGTRLRVRRLLSVSRGRPHGRPPEGVPKSRLLGYLQTHDQVGNRATGERISMLAPLERVKAGAALVMTSPFVPMIFQGEEWAASTPFLYFTNHTEPDLACAVSEGRRREFAHFGWDPQSVPDPQDRDTFLRSKLNWDERGQGEHGEMLRWYRDLIALRPRLHGDPRVTFSEGERWVRVDRGDVSVVCGFGPAARPPVDGRLLLESECVAIVER